MYIINVTDRVAVLQLPEGVSHTMRADLATLLAELTDLREQEEDTVDKITTGVSTGEKRQDKMKSII